MTKQFGGNNPILHVNLLWQICLKLQVMKTKALVKRIVLTLKNLYKVEVKVYIFENHICTELPISELSEDKLHGNSYKGRVLSFVLNGTRRESRGGGNNR